MIDTEYELSQWVRSWPNHWQAAQHDPRYHMELSVLREVLKHQERALTAEGISPEVRLRVLRRTLYGSPDPADAIQRIADQHAAVELLARQPPQPAR